VSCLSRPAIRHQTEQIFSPIFSSCKYRAGELNSPAATAAAAAAAAARRDVTRHAYQAEEFLSLRRTHLLQIDGKMTAQIRPPVPDGSFSRAGACARAPVQ